MARNIAPWQAGRLPFPFLFVTGEISNSGPTPAPSPNENFTFTVSDAGDYVFRYGPAADIQHTSGLEFPAGGQVGITVADNGVNVSTDNAQRLRVGDVDTFKEITVNLPVAGTYTLTVWTGGGSYADQVQVRISQ